MVQRDVVVIGASAGGVQALKTVVSGLPAGFPAAVLEERLLWREMEQLARERNDPAVAKECAEQTNQAEQRVQLIREVVSDKDMLGMNRTFSKAHGSKLNLTWFNIRVILNNMHQEKEQLSHPEIEKRLIDAGVQPTAQRIAICRYILCEADHPTADEIKKWADRYFPKMSLATVYNTLKTLVDAGLIQEFKFPHSDSAVYDCNTGVHYHFLDEKTGQLHDVEPESVNLSVKLREEFKINGVQVLLRGTKK